MPIKFISNVCVRLTKPMSDTATEITIRTDDAVKLNELGAGNYTYLVFSYNGNSEVVKYTHTATIPAGTKNTVVTVERDVEATGVYNFPMKACGCVDTSASAVIDLVTQLAEELGTTLVDCSGNEVTDGTAVVLCDMYNAGQAAQDAAIAQKVNNTVYLAGQATQDAAIATKVDTATYNSGQAAQDAAIALKQNALNDCTGNPLAGKVPTCAQMTTAISDAVASIVFPEVPKGLDCEAVGKLPERTYKAGDSVMVHGTDGLCARVVAKPGIFTDVRVGVVARSGSVFTNTSTDIITTIQNLAAGVATVRVDLTNPTGSGYELGIAAIEKPDAVTVTKLTDTTYTISGLGQGDKVIIRRPFKASVKGNYGFSATITVAEDNAFDYSTVDDYAGANIYVSEASTGTPTVSCPLVKLYSPDGETELPVSEYPSYTPTNGLMLYPGDPLKSFVVITEDTGYVDLPIEGATTAIAHVKVNYIGQQPVGVPILALNNDKVVQFSGLSHGVAGDYSDPVGIVLDVANKKLRIPAPPNQKLYTAAIELKAGPTCTPQLAVIAVARRSSLEITPGVVEITPTTGVTVGYDSLYGADMTTGMYTMDKDGIVGRSRITTAVKTATLTVPHGTPYTGVAKLSGISTTLSTTGNVTLKGHDDTAGNGIDITVSASATAKDTVKNFATVLSVITSD